MLFESLCSEAAQKTKEHFDEVRRDTRGGDGDRVDGDYAIETLMRQAYTAMDSLRFGDLDVLFGECPKIRDGCLGAIRDAINIAIIDSVSDEIMEYGAGSVSSSDEDEDSVPSFSIR